MQQKQFEMFEGSKRNSWLDQLCFLFLANANFEEKIGMKPLIIFLLVPKKHQPHLLSRSPTFFHEKTTSTLLRALASRNGWTPLMWAAIVGHSEVTELLIQATCDIYARDVAWRFLRETGRNGSLGRNMVIHINIYIYIYLICIVLQYCIIMEFHIV